MLKRLISRGMSKKAVTYLRGTGGKRRRTSLINARAGSCALGISHQNGVLKSTTYNTSTGG